jgi:putative SOS response-associated peptidase YedK
VCGRFTSSQRREAIGERFEVTVPETYSQRYNLAPQQRTLIVRERDDVREAVMAKWGLLPHWAKDSKIAFKMINARADTLTEKPAYRSCIGLSARRRSNSSQHMRVARGASPRR